MSFLKKLFFGGIVLTLVLLFAPGIPPHVPDADTTEVKKVPFTGALTKNNRLDKAEILTTEIEGAALGFLKGPEAIAAVGDYLYTGIYGGDVIRLNLKDKKAKWEVFHRFGPDASQCTEQRQEEECGRPLGVRADHQGKKLIINDAYLGIFSLDLKSRKAELLVSPDVELIDSNGKKRPAKLFNSVAVAKDGSVYYTLSSTTFKLHDGPMTFLAKGDGLVVKYDAKTKKNSILLDDDLVFPNGLALSADEDFLVFSDIAKNRLLKIDLKTGTSQMFAQVPGFPDNVNQNGKGGFLVGVVTPMPMEHFDLLADLAGPRPWLCRYLLRLLFNTKRIIGWINENAIGNAFLEELYYKLANFETFMGKYKYGLVVEYDEQGRVLQSWHNQDGSRAGYAEAMLYDNYVYLGSPWNQYVARVHYIS